MDRQAVPGESQPRTQKTPARGDAVFVVGDQDQDAAVVAQQAAAASGQQRREAKPGAASHRARA